MLGALLLQIVLIFLNAVFASAEIAVISLNETKLRQDAKEGDVRAKKLVDLTEQPAKFLATIQVAITLAGLLGSAFAAENFATPLVTWLIGLGVPISQQILKNIAVVLITMILAYFNLVFGELVPKRIAMKKSESMALGMAGMLSMVSKVFAPLVFLLTKSTNFILKRMGINPDEEEEQVSEEEIRMLVHVGNQQGVIDEDESEIIQNVFKLDDISIEKICTHRRNVISLSMTDSIEKWEEMIDQSRHTYYPIYGESKEDIIAILNTKEYFREKNRDKSYILNHASEEPYFVPENMKANILLKNMKQKRVYFAVLLDEYCGLSGIITLHDLIEELVGEIEEEERDVNSREYKRGTRSIYPGDVPV